MYTSNVNGKNCMDTTNEIGIQNTFSIELTIKKQVSFWFDYVGVWKSEIWLTLVLGRGWIREITWRVFMIKSSSLHHTTILKIYIQEMYPAIFEIFYSIYLALVHSVDVIATSTRLVRPWTMVMSSHHTANTFQKHQYYIKFTWPQNVALWCSISFVFFSIRLFIHYFYFCTAIENNLKKSTFFMLTMCLLWNYTFYGLKHWKNL